MKTTSSTPEISLLYGPVVGMLIAFWMHMLNIYAVALLAAGCVSAFFLFVSKSNHQKTIARRLLFGVVFAFVFPAALFFLLLFISFGRI